MLKIKRFVFNPFGMNSYIIFDPDTRDAIAVDPGMASQSEINLFDNYIADNNLHLTQIVNTHLHLDHCFGDNYVRDKYDVKIAAHSADGPLGAQITVQARQFGLIIPDKRNVNIDFPLNDGDVINVGTGSLAVLHVPGHSPGSIALYSAKDGLAIVGDVLFRGSVGRTDLPGGDHGTLLRSIKQKLLTLPENTIILPGHEAPTNIRDEKVHNPYLR